MIPVFINHYPPLTDRRKYLESVLNEPITWSIEPTKEDITNETRQEWYLDCKDAWSNKDNNSTYRKLTNGDISCSIGHILGWEKFLKTKEKYGLFLEDDVIINCDDIDFKISDVLEKCPKNADVIFVGGGFDHYIVSKTIKIENDNFHLKSPPNTNCAISYILKRSAAKKMLKICKPFTMPIDFEMNYLFKKLNFRVYHHIPYFIGEGSKSGHYNSIQGNH